jgi:peroxiredoxin (alkyl hydroperoxide reductase subunit C)
VSAIYGISTQSTEYQLEAATRLHLPFALLSDAKLHLTEALLLPTMEVSGMTLIRRLTLILHDSTIEHVFFPVFPPDRNAADVLNFMKNTRHRIVNIDMENE